MINNKDLAKLIIDVVNQTDNDYDAREEVEDTLNQHRQVSILKRLGQLFTISKQFDNVKD